MAMENIKETAPYKVGFNKGVWFGTIGTAFSSLFFLAAYDIASDVVSPPPACATLSTSATPTVVPHPVPKRT